MADVPTARIIEVAAFVGVCGARLPERPEPFALGEFSGPRSRHLRRGACETIYVPRHAGDAAAPADGPVALVWGRPFRADDTRVAAGDDEAALDAAHLDGTFIVARLDDDRVELHTDRVGGGSVLYCEQAGAVYFASHLGPLLSVLPRIPKLNDLGVAEMIFFRAQLGDETYLSGIYRVPAGRFLALERIDGGGRTRARLKPAFEIRDLLGRDVPAYTPETINDMVDLGVRREGFGPQDALLLSAGRDSLLIALAQGAPRRAAVYGEPYAADRIGGEARARQLGMELVPYSRRDWDLGTYLPLVTKLFGGGVGLNVTNSIIGTHGLAPPPPLLACGNYGGSMLLGDRHFDPEPMTGQRAARFQLMNFKDPVANGLFAEEKAHLVDLLAREFDELRRAAPLHVALRLTCWRRLDSRRFGMSKLLMDWFAPLAFPYLNHGFFTMVVNTPAAPLNDRTISNAALQRRLERYPVPLRDRLISPKRVAQRQARRHRARVVGQTYWPDVMRRRPIGADELVCGHERLDAYLQATWDKRDERQSAAPPRFLFAAGMAAAIREFGI